MADCAGNAKSGLRMVPEVKIDTTRVTVPAMLVASLWSGQSGTEPRIGLIWNRTYTGSR